MVGCIGQEALDRGCSRQLGKRLVSYFFGQARGTSAAASLRRPAAQRSRCSREVCVLLGGKYRLPGKGAFCRDLFDRKHPALGRWRCWLQARAKHQNPSRRNDKESQKEQSLSSPSLGALEVIDSHQLCFITPKWWRLGEDVGTRIYIVVALVLTE